MAAEKCYKVICLGTIEVGKTSLIVRLVDNSFTEGKLDNFDKKEVTINVDGKPVKLQITDTAGQERFRTLTSSYYRKADAMIIVYDITSKESFEDLDGYIKEGTRYSERSDKFIVGNKTDLADKRVIDTAVGKKLADDQGLPFFEVSAKTGESVRKLFEAVARKLAGVPESGTSTQSNSTVDLSSGGPGQNNNASKPKKPGVCMV